MIHSNKDQKRLDYIINWKMTSNQIRESSHGGSEQMQSDVRTGQFKTETSSFNTQIEQKNKENKRLKIVILITATLLLSIIGYSFWEQLQKVKQKLAEVELKQKEEQNRIEELQIELDQQKNKIDQMTRNTPYVVNQKISQIGGTKPVKNSHVWTIQYLSKNINGQTIDQVLYKTQQQRSQRIFAHQQRKTFVKRYNMLQSLDQSIFNMKTDHQDDQYETRRLTFQYNRINPLHNLQQTTQELPMCIITPSYKNNAKFRIQYNLNSIFTQNYSNYFAVITNDFSQDGSDQLYRKYFQFYNIPSSKYIYINNTKRKGAMENDYNANHMYCSNDAISVHLDGDDQFIGKNVLKIFNAEYQRLKAGALYSSFFFYSLNQWARNGFTSQYPQFVKKQGTFRHSPMRFSHLKTYRTELFRKIDKSYFIDNSGQWFSFASDVVFFIPIMQRSCGRVHKISGYHYLYNQVTGLNQDTISRPKQVLADQQSRSKPSLGCDQEWKKKVDALP